MTQERVDRNLGFTLIEVLIGTTLLAIMMSLLMGSLFSISRGARAGESRLDTLGSQRLIHAFLRNQIAGAVPLTERVEQRDHVYFDGRPDSVRFVGHLPAHRGGGGLQFVQIDIDDASAGPALVLRYRNAWAEADFVPATYSAEWQRTELLDEVSDVHFRYFGSDDKAVPPEWTDRWVDRASLPSLVQIAIESTDSRKWPELSVAVRTLTAAGQPQLISTRER
jgi:general secretion pathway protein J